MSIQDLILSCKKASVKMACFHIKCINNGNRNDEVMGDIYYLYWAQDFLCRLANGEACEGIDTGLIKEQILEVINKY